MRSTEVVKRDMNRFMRDLNTYQAHDLDDIPLYLLGECVATLGRPLETPFRSQLGEGLLPRE